MNVSYDKTPEEWADWLCDEIAKRRFALTGVTYAVQERIGQNIVLAPADPARRVDSGAGTYTTSFPQVGRKDPFITHIIRYSEPQCRGNQFDEAELVELILDIGHELGHLLLGYGGPGYFPERPEVVLGTATGDVTIKEIEEIEADWFALCILQMYGFLPPPPK